MLEKEEWMTELWQPLLDQILKIHQDYTTGKSNCNIILLTTERDFFNEFEKHFVEPAFKEITYVDVISGYYLEKHVNEIKEVIFLNFPGIDWFNRNVKSLKKFLEISRQHKKFLILCAYDYSLPEFHRGLKRAFTGEPLPEIREFRLKSPE
jgi:hypothetical protein